MRDVILVGLWFVLAGAFSFFGLFFSLWALIETIEISRFFASGPSPRAPKYFKQYIFFWLWLIILIIITSPMASVTSIFFGFSSVSLFSINILLFNWILILVLILVLLVRVFAEFNSYPVRFVVSFLHKLYSLVHIVWHRDAASLTVGWRGFKYY